jgi:hypothetical protein
LTKLAGEADRFPCFLPPLPGPVLQKVEVQLAPLGPGLGPIAAGTIGQCVSASGKGRGTLSDSGGGYLRPEVERSQACKAQPETRVLNEVRVKAPGEEQHEGGHNVPPLQCGPASTAGRERVGGGAQEHSGCVCVTWHGTGKVLDGQEKEAEKKGVTSEPEENPRLVPGEETALTGDPSPLVLVSNPTEAPLESMPSPEASVELQTFRVPEAIIANSPPDVRGLSSSLPGHSPVTASYALDSPEILQLKRRFSLERMQEDPVLALHFKEVDLTAKEHQVEEVLGSPHQPAEEKPACKRSLRTMRRLITMQDKEGNK